jgi:hypothetical protein
MSDSAHKFNLDLQEKPSDEYVENQDLGARTLAVKRLHDGQDHGSSDHRLIVDVKEAKREYGVEVASALKTTEEGTYVLWPQPRDDPHDPLNASRPALYFYITADAYGYFE